MTKMKTSGRTQPRISGSHRLTNSPVYFTPAASRSSSSFGSSIRVVLKFRLPSGFALVGAPNRLLTDVDLGDLAGAHRLLEVAVRDLPPARSQEPRLQQNEQQQPAQEVPDRSPGASARPQRTPLTWTLVARIQPRRCSKIRQ